MTPRPGPDTSELERRYRRLLRWYPRAYRTERGTELVTTLLDTAGPDRRRPTRRDAVDLAWGGLRQRFRLPLGFAVRVTAVAAALIAGAMGAAAGAWAVWLTSPGLPADTQARQIIGTVMGVPYDAGLNRSVGPFGDLLPAVEPSSPAYVGNARSDNLPGSTTDAVVSRLTAAGWSIDSIPLSPPDGEELSASRDGLVVWVQWMRNPGAAAPAATFLSVTIVEEDPGLLPAGLAAGWLIGAVGGWLLVAATAYRIRRHGGTGVQVVAGLLTIGALTGLFLPTVVAYTAMQSFGPQRRFPAAPWTGYTLWPLDWMALLGITATVTVVALSVLLPARRRTTPATDPGPQRAA
jgi:hypothetical protein